MQSITDKVIARIYGHGRGWAFTQIDFVDIGSRQSIDVALHRLYKSGRIRRALRGLYYYPDYSEYLNTELSPDYDQLAQAIARKYNWRIQVSGSTALNYLGLSTQVPGRMIYMSDGPSKEFTINEKTIEFKHTALKEAGFKHRESSIIVQALRAMGQNKITDDVKKRIRKWLMDSKRFAIPNGSEKSSGTVSGEDAKKLYKSAQILKDTKTVTGWINKVIRDIILGTD